MRPGCCNAALQPTAEARRGRPGRFARGVPPPHRYPRGPTGTRRGGPGANTSRRSRRSTGWARPRSSPPYSPGMVAPDRRRSSRMAGGDAARPVSATIAGSTTGRKAASNPPSPPRGQAQGPCRETTPRGRSGAGTCSPGLAGRASPRAPLRPRRGPARDGHGRSPHRPCLGRLPGSRGSCRGVGVAGGGLRGWPTWTWCGEARPVAGPMGDPRETAFGLSATGNEHPGWRGARGAKPRRIQRHRGTRSE